jgi:hypothetical protein
MKMFQWNKGRQKGAYEKLPILNSRLLGCDAYILRFPRGCSVMKHKDPVAEGYRHYRMNVILKKPSNFRDRMYILGPIKRWWRFEIFRPDLYEHGLQPINESMWMLSMGCRVKS